MWRYGWLSIRHWRSNQFCWRHGWSCRGFSREWLEKLVKEDRGHGWGTPSVFYFPFDWLESNKTTRVPRNQVPPSKEPSVHVEIKWKTCWALAAHTLHGRVLKTWWGWRTKNVQSPWMSFMILLMSVGAISLIAWLALWCEGKRTEVGFWKNALRSLVLTVA